MRDAFVRTLIELAKQDRNIELLTGDLGFGVLKPFWEQLPDQFTNVGIAEQNMTTLAAGMAMEGKTVFTYSIGNFPTLRCLEQIRNDWNRHAEKGRRSDRRYGYGHTARGAVGKAADALQLLQAAFRAGNKPAYRRDKRADRNIDIHAFRLRAEPSHFVGA